MCQLITTECERYTAEICFVCPTFAKRFVELNLRKPSALSVNLASLKFKL